jgi:hypothetical protein
MGSWNMQGAGGGLLENCRKVRVVIAARRPSANTKSKELMDSHALRIREGPDRQLVLGARIYSNYAKNRPEGHTRGLQGIKQGLQGSEQLHCDYLVGTGAH